MTDTLRYDFDSEHRLTLDVPQPVLESALPNSRIKEILSRPEKLVLYKESRDGGRFTFDTAAFQEEDRTEERAESHASQWLHTLVKIEQYTPKELRDPQLHVKMSLAPLDDLSGQGRRGMHAILPWPSPEDEQKAQDEATAAMRVIALKFGYLHLSIASAAYATVNRERGMEFQALDMGCSCLGTSGAFYDPEVSKAELHGHNLYNRQLVLTCLTGLVTVARQNRGEVL